MHSIRARLITALVAAFVVAVGVVAIIISSIAGEAISELEREAIAREVTRGQNIIADHLDRLKASARDYACWDDTYEYLSNPSKHSTYFPDNYSHDSLGNLKIDFAALADARGEIVNQIWLPSIKTDAESGKARRAGELSAFVAKRLFPEPINYPLAGLLFLGDSPYLVGVSPVLRSNSGGPVNGILVFGQRIDYDFLEDLGKSTLAKVSIKSHHVGDDKTPGGLTDVTVEHGKALGIVHIDALDGDRSLNLSLVVDRFSSRSSIASFGALFSFIVIALVAVLVLTIRYIDLIMLKRLKVINELVVSPSPGKPVNVTTLENDEISNIARAVVHAIDTERSMRRRVQESENRIQLALAGGELGFWEWNVSTGEVFFSQRCRRLLGFRADEEPKSLAELENHIHPEDSQSVMASLLSMNKGTGSKWESEFRVRGPNDTTLFILARGQIAEVDMQDHARVNALPAIERHFFAIIQDVTQRVTAVAGHLESERRLASIIDNLQDAYVRTDRHGNFVMLSPSAVKIFGYPSLDDFIGRHAAMIYKNPGTRDEILEEMRPKGYVHDRVCEGVKNDGTTFWMSLNARFYNDELGQMLGTEAVIRDITERKRAQDELALVAERLDISLRAANMGVWTWDLQKGRMSFDAKICAILGIAMEGYGGTLEEVRKVVEPGDWKRLKCALRKTLREDSLYEVDFGVLLPEESLRHVVARGNIARDAHGRPIKISGVAWDDTEAFLAAKERESLRQQLIQAQKIDSIGRLAGGVAHDFNNMLGVILGYTEICLERISPSHPLYNELTEIQKAATRSADITRQLLAFARKQTLAPKVVDLNDSVEAMLKMIRRLIGEDIDLAWRPGNNLWRVRIDPTQLDQILANLTTNARDAIKGGGRITIETANVVLDEEYAAAHRGFVPGDFAALVISDDGSGMDKEKLARIFEPFFTTKGLGEGTGLGLSTVYGIVKQSGGFINTYSEVGHGTTFKIYFPRVEGGQTATVPEIAAPQKGNETILLVEDDEATLMLGERILTSLGYNVLAAISPDKALKIAGEPGVSFDLLVTDIVMPRMNGKELACKLKEMRPGLKCLFMSGYTANVITTRGVLDDKLNFLQKPYSKKDIGAKVREILDKNS